MELLVETIDPADKRAKVLQIARAGKSLLPKLEKLMNEVCSTSFAGLTAEEKDNLLLATNKVHGISGKLLIENRHKSFTQLKTILAKALKQAWAS